MGYKRILCAAFAVMMLAVFIPNRVFAYASADSYVDRFINGGGVELGLYPESDQEAIDPLDIEGRYKIKKADDQNADHSDEMYAIDIYNDRDHFDIGDECGYINYYFGGEGKYSALLFMVDVNTYLIFDPDSMEGYRDFELTFLQVKKVDSNIIVDVYKNGVYDYSYEMIEHVVL